MLKKTKNYIFEHKYMFILGLVIVIGISYYAYSKITNTDNSVKYIFGTVKKGELISSVSGSGQIVPVNQIDLKPKASGDIIYLKAIAGTKVNAGDIIAKLDTKDVVANIRDANTSLESAKLSYDKYLTQNSEEKLTYNLIKSYDNAYAAVNSALLDIPALLNNLDDIRIKESLSDNSAKIIGGDKAVSMKEKAESKYYIAENSIKQLVSNYKGLDRKSTNSVIKKSVEDAYVASKYLSDAIKLQKDLADYLYEESGRSVSYLQIQTQLGSYTSTVNNHSSLLLSALNNIQDSESAFTDTTLGIKSSSLTIKERQNALIDAKDKLEDYIVRAPFSGLIAKSDVEVGDSATPSTVVATIITKQKIAEISLNEVDAAKVKIGQKAELTFDAISGLTIPGKISEIDLVGTESQGVVTYDVKIALDSEDDQIKPGMSVSAVITTDVKSNVLLAPNSAIKKQNGNHYVEVSDEQVANNNSTQFQKGVVLTKGVQRKNIEIGLSNDDYTEILGGLNEGDKIIIRTISQTNAAAKTNSSSVRLPGIPH